MTLVIHKLDVSPPCRAVLMIAEFLDLKYETREVNILNGDHMKPEYLQKNPQHTIPLLEDRDFVLADSHAIITYLVSKYGADKRAELYPSDLALRATIDHRLFFDASILLPTSKAIMWSIVQDKVSSLSEKQIAGVEETYGVLEKYLEKTRFVACDYLTLADVSCVASVSTMNVLVPIANQFEKLRTWLDRLKDENWYQLANVLGLKEMEQYVKNTMEQNLA